MMNLFRFLPIMCLPLAPLAAEVPSLLNYQGRISAAGVPLNGSGQFKFALLNSAGTAVLWSNSPDTSPADGVPDQSVALTVASGHYSVLLGDSTLPDMAAIPPGVFQNSGLRLRVWFNDGSHGMQQLSPDQRIASAGFSLIAGTVPDGAITSPKIASGAVGSTQLANGAVTSDKIAAGAVDGTHLAAGSVGFTQLATGATAANLNTAGQSGIAAGGVIMSDNPYDPAMASAGYVKIGTTAISDSWDRRDLSSPPVGATRYDHTAIWTGTEMIIWGGQYIINTGYRYNPASNSWSPTPIAFAPSARSNHTAVWTGTEMIIFGGWNGSQPVGNGARYSPSANQWREMEQSGSSRVLHSAVWTGTEMIIWGGYNGVDVITFGARYNPAAGPSGNTGAPIGTWRYMTAGGEPAARQYHCAVWTGTEMIIWGGDTRFSPPGKLGDGGRFNPDTGPIDPFSGLPIGTWSPVSNSGAPDARTEAKAIWTGSEMIVWGGWNAGGVTNSGGRYSPSTDTWSPTPSAGAPSARVSHSMVWTGSKVMVWGGNNGFVNSAAHADGAIYDPAAGPGGSWTPIPADASFSGRIGHTAIWTGSEMIVWGGVNKADGGRYQPTTGTWTVLSAPPFGRIDHSTVWTGSEMIIWGGGGRGGPAYSDGARYDPALDRWRPISNTGAPSPRRNHSAVWTGSQMIVWGGYDSVYFNDGKRYAPASDTWTSMSTDSAPSARHRHTAVWTGTEMVIWGGSLGAFPTIYRDTGGRYNPTSDQWRATSMDLVPAARDYHSTAWTGSEMIIWGGTNGTQFGDGARYNPEEDSWTSCAAASAPSPREQATAVWTGSEMVVWGGYHSVNPLTNTGARYLPTGGGNDPNTGKPLGVWTPITNSGAPYQRSGHTAVWTGRFMVIWGAGGVINPDHGLYDLAANTWIPVTTENAPVSRGQHSAVWTGTTMIIWGGALGSTVYSDTYGYNPPRTMTLYQKP